MLDALKDRAQVKNDVLSGLTVALALVPEAVAFAFVAQVEPLVGLYAAFIVCLTTALIGGRPGMISGAAGALAVVMVSLVVDHGVQYLFATVILMGALQMLAGWLRLGKFIRLVPHSVMLGFVNGLAIVIFLAQKTQFQNKAGQWLDNQTIMVMCALIALTMAVIFILPRFLKAVPSTLVAIVGVTLLVLFGGIDTKTVGDVASIAGGMPEFNIPMVPFTFETLKIIFPYAVILAAIGLIESLLTLRLIDEITETRGRGNKECVGQGVANVATGFFGGMGGCAMIGQSLININSGGRGRLSGVTAALALLSFILVASSLIEMVPVAALVGVMFVVVIKTFEWASFKMMGQVPKKDAFIIVLVSAITVISDLAVAVLAGVIVSALIFAWEHAKHVSVRRIEGRENSSIYTVHGPLFFASVTEFLKQFQPADDLNNVVIDFADSRVVDQSGIAALDTLAERYSAVGKKLHLIHLSPDCKRLLHKARDLVTVNVVEDPKYFVADDAIA